LRDEIYNKVNRWNAHYYNPAYKSLTDLGLKPHFLTDRVLDGMFRLVERYKSGINRDAIYRGGNGNEKRLNSGLQKKMWLRRFFLGEGYV
jgi:hypothetical protein